MLLLGSAGKGILVGELSGVCQMCCLRGRLCRRTQEMSQRSAPEPAGFHVHAGNHAAALLGLDHLLQPHKWIEPQTRGGCWPESSKLHLLRSRIL